MVNQMRLYRDFFHFFNTVSISVSIYIISAFIKFEIKVYLFSS